MNGLKPIFRADLWRWGRVPWQTLFVEAEFFRGVFFHSTGRLEMKFSVPEENHVRYTIEINRNAGSRWTRLNRST